MAIKAVVFDLDGTITRFNLDYKAVRAEVRNMLMNSGVPESLLPMEGSTFRMIKESSKYLRTSGRLVREVQMIVCKVLAVIEKRELEAAKTTDLLPGVSQMLRALRKDRIRIGLCTVNGDVSAEYILNKFAIRRFFDSVVSRDKVTNVKPEKEHLQYVLRALNVNASNAAVVGDGTSDMKCARAIGAIAIGLPTGVSTLNNLINAGADYVITKMTDLPKLITELNGSFPEEIPHVT